MNSYIVESDSLVIASRGSLITEEQLAGCNVEALIEGGHLSPAKTAHDPADEAIDSKKE